MDVLMTIGAKDMPIVLHVRPIHVIDIIQTRYLFLLDAAVVADVTK